MGKSPLAVRGYHPRCRCVGKSPPEVKSGMSASGVKLRPYLIDERYVREWPLAATCMERYVREWRWSCVCL